MKSFKTKIFIHRDTENNWNIISNAERLNFQNPDYLKYLGYEVYFEVEIFEDGTNKVLSINNIDVSNLNINI